MRRKEDISNAFVSIKAKARTLGERAIAGEPADELSSEQAALYDEIVAVLVKVNPDREIIDPRGLRRALADLILVGVREAVSNRNRVHAARERIARLEAMLVEIVEPSRTFYAR